ncbi:hypothetical protein PGTUg99_000181 [Puccinia graminis f. sp. tritici]|uniref:Uncharacterized protein n=1 Tax=Puccinia graminis f. sp. tritici TaxID=56615 RepID=A0A5B0NNE5_PUCGR|nr:hypothetical protein PGTUg99_000181 [Puccinia graminis f. sp. tritici]
MGALASLSGVKNCFCPASWPSESECLPGPWHLASDHSSTHSTLYSASIRPIYAQGLNHHQAEPGRHW